MKKRFTLLFAALLAFVGVAKADFTLSYKQQTGFWGDAITEYPSEIGTLITENSISSAEVHSLDQEIDVVANGDVVVTFTHVDGAHKQHLLGVVLKGGDDAVVKADYHYGTHPGTNNTYTLSGVEAGTYTLSFYVTNNGGDNVNRFGGNITVTGADEPGVVTSAADLDNSKVYTVTANENRGSWYYSPEQNALTSTTKAGIAVDATDLKQQFAFLTVDSKVYVYNAFAEKFVIKNDKYTTFVDYPEAYVTLEVSGNANFPVVVALNGANHVGISNGFNPAVITFNNSLSDGGNQVKLVAVEGTFDNSAALAKLTKGLAAERNALLATAKSANELYATIEDKTLEVVVALKTQVDAAVAAANADDATTETLSAANASLVAAIAVCDPLVYNLLEEFDLSTQLFCLKLANANLYMTVVEAESGNDDAGGVQVKGWAEKSVKQVYSFAAVEGEAGKYKIKSSEGYYLTTFGRWGSKATATDSDGAIHEIAYVGEGKYTFKTALGFVGPNNATDGQYLYSNHGADKANIYWTLEPIEGSLLNYTLTDALGNEYTGIYHGIAGEDMPVLAGAAGCNFSDVVWNGTAVSAKVAFPFPISNANTINATMIGAHNSDQLLWYATESGVATTMGAKADSENFYWAIYPKFNEGSFSFMIKNLGARKYIYSTSNENKHEAGVVTLADEGSLFTFEANNQFKLSTGKYLSVNSSNVDSETVQILGTWSSHGGTKNKFVAYPGLDADVKAAFIEKFAAFDALKEGEALSKLTTMKAQWDNVAVVVAPMSKAIEAGHFVYTADVVAATNSMATVTTAVKPVLEYFNGDYKAASDKVKTFFDKLEEGSEARTALATAIATFEAVADVTTVAELETKVAAVNTAYDEQYAAYDLSAVKDDFLYQAEMFSYYGDDEDLKAFGGLRGTWNSVNSFNEQILEKITADELVLKGDVEYAMEAMEEADAKIESILAYYSETYKPTLDYAEAILDKYEEESDEYNSLAAVIEASKELTYVYNVSSLEYMVADLKANEVYALYDIDAPITTGEEGWVEACYYVQGEKRSFLPNADLEVEEYEEEGEVITELPGCVYKNVTEMSSGFVVLGAPAELTEANSAAYLRQAVAFDPGQYRLTGKAFDKGVSNAVMFVYDTNTGDTINKVSIAVAGEEFYFEDVVLEFIIDDYLDLAVGYSCKFEEAEAQLVVGGFKLEKGAAVTTTLREQFKEVYQGDMMQGVTGFSMLTNIEPYNMLEAMHPAYKVLFAEVDAIYGAMWEGVPTDTATVAKAIRSMEAMKADFDAVANYLMSDDYWNTTQDALEAIEGYMEESDVYAQLMEAYSAAKGAVYDEEEDALKYYATFTSVADIEAALKDLAEELEAAEAKIPDAITLVEEAELSDNQRTIQLTATVEAESENADMSIFWESDDEEVATVDENGLVTAVAEGTAYITAYSIHKNVSAVCEVTVTALTDGIDNFEVKVETVIYDIHGRQVEKMEKGFYIVNGKKVLVK